MWIFTSTIFRLALEITLLLNKYFFPQNLISGEGGPNKRGVVGKCFEKKNMRRGGGRFLRTQE